MEPLQGSQPFLAMDPECARPVVREMMSPRGLAGRPWAEIFNSFGVKIMPLTTAQFQEQKKQAEELLFSGPETLGFAKGLFFGHFNAALVFPYPELNPDEVPALDTSLADLRRFAAQHIDAAAIDRNADIPPEVIDGLGEFGVLGMAAPHRVRRPGFSQSAYCKIMEVIGGHCASTAVFVNAHHSIGIRGLVLFGTEEQKRRWLPDLVTGKKLAAFALTEPEAGSDAANVQTTATPSADGKTFVLNGQKRYITNGAIAQVLTVMARTPVPGSSETRSHGISGDARHARLRGGRGAHAQVRHPRHRHRPARFSQHAGPRGEHPGADRQGPARRPDRARLWPHHVRRQLHRRRQDLPQGSRAIMPTDASSSSKRLANSS